MLASMLLSGNPALPFMWQHVLCDAVNFDLRDFDKTSKLKNETVLF